MTYGGRTLQAVEPYKLTLGPEAGHVVVIAELIIRAGQKAIESKRYPDLDAILAMFRQIKHAEPPPEKVEQARADLANGKDYLLEVRFTRTQRRWLAGPEFSGAQFSAQ